MTRRFAIPVGITATGEFYPDRIVTNDDLAKMVDTSDEWITTRTGIKHRRWVEPGVGSSDLGAKALQMALERRGIAADELDAIVACTVTPDMMFPCTAALIQTKVGATKAFGFDLNAACSSWLFGLTTAASLVAGGRRQARGRRGLRRDDLHLRQDRPQHRRPVRRRRRRGDRGSGGGRLRHPGLRAEDRRQRARPSSACPPADP